MAAYSLLLLLAFSKFEEQKKQNIQGLVITGNKIITFKFQVLILNFECIILLIT